MDLLSMSDSDSTHGGTAQSTRPNVATTAPSSVRVTTSTHTSSGVDSEVVESEVVVVVTAPGSCSNSAARTVAHPAPYTSTLVPGATEAARTSATSRSTLVVSALSILDADVYVRVSFLIFPRGFYRTPP